MSDLKDQVTLVIGAAAGIGLASSRALAAKGATVVIADRNGAAAERAADEMRAAGGKANPYQVDVSSMSELRSLFDFVDKSHGRLNVLFSNVGSQCADGFDISEEQFNEAFDINLKSHFFATNFAVPLMRLCAPKASIIYMSSGAGFRFFGRSPLYAISKSSILMMMRAFARHLGPQGIRVNALCPGAVDTGFPREGKSDAEHEAMIASLSKEIPLRRIAQPEDVARVVAFLASDDSMYLTGVSIPVDGGSLA